MLKTIPWLAMVSLLSGCASTQLNYNTNDIAKNSDSLLTTQILYNFANYLDSAVAVPAQIVVSSGATSTSNSITPTLSFPLTNAVTSSASLVAAASPSKTNLLSSVSASQSLSLAASDSWNQTYAFSTITDPERFARLNSLYRYVTTWSDEGIIGDTKLIDSYPLLQKSITYLTPLCLKSASGEMKMRAPNQQIDPTTKSKIELICATQMTGGQEPSVTLTHAGGTSSVADNIPDDHYLKGPGCIICYGRETHGKKVNENIRGAWLHWEDAADGVVPPGRRRRDDDVYIGRAGHYVFYVDKGKHGENAEKFVHFTIAVLAASTQTGTTGASASGSTSGQGTAKPSTNALIGPNGIEQIIGP